MASHKLNPNTNEVWEHPDTKNLYVIHSVTDDGWVRYVSGSPKYPTNTSYPFFTQPTMDFISKYRKVDSMGTGVFQ